MDKVRMLVLQAFTRNIDGQMVVGEPDHPDEESRYVRVSPKAATELEDAGLAEPYSEEEEMRDRIRDEDAAEEERKAAIANGDPDGGRNVGGASTDGIAPNKSAQAVRNERTDTSNRKAQSTRKGAARRPGRRGGAPAGGNETNATTNNATETPNGDEITNAGAAVAEPDPDAPPAA